MGTYYLKYLQQDEEIEQDKALEGCLHLGFVLTHCMLQH